MPEQVHQRSDPEGHGLLDEQALEAEGEARREVPLGRRTTATITETVSRGLKGLADIAIADVRIAGAREIAEGVVETASVCLESDKTMQAMWDKRS
jgi:hypothetical protein